jgi:hypothetical protein
MNSTNYWSWKDSELKDQLEGYKIELDGGYNRKAAIEAIKAKDLEVIKNGITINEDGKQKYMEELKAEGIETRKVMFHSSGEQDIPYVFVGHNGKGFYIPKEKPVDVPVYILNSCIKDAIEDRMFPQTQMDGSIEWIIRKVQRYPYSFMEI